MEALECDERTKSRIRNNWSRDFSPTWVKKTSLCKYYWINLFVLTLESQVQRIRTYQLPSLPLRRSDNGELCVFYWYNSSLFSEWLGVWAKRVLGLNAVGNINGAEARRKLNGVVMVPILSMHASLHKENTRISRWQFTVTVWQPCREGDRVRTNLTLNVMYFFLVTEFCKLVLPDWWTSFHEWGRTWHVHCLL